MANEGDRSRRMAALDGLRGLCACIVIAYHMPTGGYLGGSTFVRNGFLFVDFFFVLSGLVIYRAGTRGAGWAGFMGRRLSRVLPLHVVTMLAFLTMNVALAVLNLRGQGRGAFTAPDDPGNFLINLLLLQNFVTEDLRWNVPSWSIAAEVWTYAAFGWVMSRAPRTTPAFAAAVVVAALAALLAWPTHHIAVYGLGAIVRAMLGFGVGVLIAELLGRTPTTAIAGPRAAVLEFAAVGATYAFAATVGGRSYWSLAAPFVFGATVLAFAIGGGPLSALLRRRWLVAVGGWSYAIYIGHFFLVQRIAPKPLAALLGADWTHRPLVADLATMAVVGLVVLFGWFATTVIEPPLAAACRRLLDRVAGQRPGDADRRGDPLIGLVPAPSTS